MKKKQINLQDISILNILTEHAELNNKQLAECIGLSEGPTLVRVQRLWQKGIVRAQSALIDYQFFGYTKFYCIRIEIRDTEAHKLKLRFFLSRYIIFLMEIEASLDINMRVYLGTCLTKNLQTAKEEIQLLTEGLKGIGSATLTPANSVIVKPILLDNTDVVK